MPLERTYSTAPNASMFVSLVTFPAVGALAIKGCAISLKT